MRPGIRNLLIGLAALYVLELVVANFVLPAPGPGQLSILYDWMAWNPMPTQPLWEQAWQPLTKYFVQGPNFIGVFFSLIVIYFFLPWALDRFVPRHLGQMAAAVVLGCFVFGLLWAGLAWTALQAGVPASSGWFRAPAMGYEPFMLGLIAVFALAQPDRTISLFFVLPIKAMWVLWISIGFAALSFLANPGVGSFELFGALAGIVAWWFWLGPGGTRRRFKRSGRQIEKDLKLRVYDGGKQGSQGDPDEWIN